MLIQESDSVLRIDGARLLKQIPRESHRFTRVRPTGCTVGWYLFHDTPDGAENVYFDPEDPRSEGFYGRTIEFLLDTDRHPEAVHPAVGPWHSNADALFDRTGIDLRDRHRTYGAIALEKTMTTYETRLHGILHLDSAVTVGRFSRLEDLAHDWQRRLGRPVTVYRESAGGSSLVTL
jgi:hypothetical protein